MYKLQAEDLEDWRGVKDMAQYMWSSPSPQSKYPAPTDDHWHIVTWASNYCSIVVFGVWLGDCDMYI